MEYPKYGKGILDYINSLPSTELYFKPPTIKELEKLFFEVDKENQERRIKENKIIKQNLKQLTIKSKAFNEEIPEELLMYIWLNQPISMRIYEKYEKWIK